jgi:hypothetical protein
MEEIAEERREREDRNEQKRLEQAEKMVEIRVKAQKD